MKTLFRTTVTLAALALAGGAVAAPRVATLDVENVSCVACAPIVKRTLSRVSGVSQVSVIERDGMAIATVSFDDEKVTAQALAQATTNAGYPSTVKEVKSAMNTGTTTTASR
uniref:Mercuric transport protein n=1 Tax=Pseudomonas sp. K-62 TaxID=76885 RepID=I2FG49_9PSED|nr:cation transporter [Pseudomonas sp. K-62]BAM13984.1 mercuric transport protein [Pseudomonas sp. K-62]